MKYQDCCNDYDGLYAEGKKTEMSAETGYSSKELTGRDSVCERYEKCLTNLDNEHHDIE